MTDPINLDTTPVPEDWLLVQGNFLANTARNLKIPFRLAGTNPVRCPKSGKVPSHMVPAGILIREQDKPVWDAAIVKKHARSDQKKAHPEWQR